MSNLRVPSNGRPGGYIKELAVFPGMHKQVVPETDACLTVRNRYLSSPYEYLGFDI